MIFSKTNIISLSNNYMEYSTYMGIL